MKHFNAPAERHYQDPKFMSMSATDTGYYYKLMLYISQAHDQGRLPISTAKKVVGTHKWKEIEEDILGKNSKISREWRNLFGINDGRIYDLNWMQDQKAWEDRKKRYAKLSDKKRKKVRKVSDTEVVPKGTTKEKSTTPLGGSSPSRKDSLKIVPASFDALKKEVR